MCDLICPLRLELLRKRGWQGNRITKAMNSSPVTSRKRLQSSDGGTKRLAYLVPITMRRINEPFLQRSAPPRTRPTNRSESRSPKTMHGAPVVQDVKCDWIPGENAGSDRSGRETQLLPSQNLPLLIMRRQRNERCWPTFEYDTAFSHTQ